MVTKVVLTPAAYIPAYYLMPKPNNRFGVAAALALQGYVAEERFASGALPAQQ